MSDETDESHSLTEQRLRHRQYLEEIETAALAAVPDSVETDTIEVIPEPIIGEVTPPTVVRTSAREFPVDTPTPARMPPSAKPLPRVRLATTRSPESATVQLPAAEAPVAIPPSIVPPRPARSDPSDLAAIAGAAAIAPDRLPWERPEAAPPQPLALEPGYPDYEPDSELENQRPQRSFLWLWYLLILATTVATGWYAWMWFARDELHPPPVTEIVESIGNHLFSWGVI